MIALVSNMEGSGTQESVTPGGALAAGAPEVRFVDMNGEEIGEDDALPSVDGRIICAIVDDYGPADSDPPYDGSVSTDSDDGGDGGPPIQPTTPTIPQTQLFKVRMSRPENAPSTVTATLRGLDICGCPEGEKEIVLSVGAEPGWYESDKPILAYTGYAPSSAQASFPQWTLIGIDEVEVEFAQSKMSKKGTIVPRLARTVSTDGRGIYELNDEVSVYCIIYSNIDGSWKAYYGYSDQDGVPNIINVGEISRWDGNKNGEFSFAWSNVWPRWFDYDNTLPGRAWDDLEYDSSPIQDESGWSIDVGGAAGLWRYTVDVQYKGKTYKAPSEETRTHGTEKDNCISDDVMRVIVKGDHTEGNTEYLNWAVALSNTSWIFGSYWEHQTKRFIGADCADYAMLAYELWGGTLPSLHEKDGPSSSKIVDWARDAQIPGISIVRELSDSWIIPEDILVPGDLIIFYKPGRGFRHVVVLYSVDGDGVLSAGDLLYQANCEHPGGAHYRVGLGQFRFKTDRDGSARYPKAVVVRLSR